MTANKTPAANPKMRYRRVILKEMYSLIILFKSDNERRFLLIIKADIKSAA